MCVSVTSKVYVKSILDKPTKATWIMVSICLAFGIQNQTSTQANRMSKNIDPDPPSPAKRCARYVASIPQSFMQIRAILFEL